MPVRSQSSEALRTRGPSCLARRFHVAWTTAEPSTSPRTVRDIAARAPLLVERQRQRGTPAERDAERQTDEQQQQGETEHGLERVGRRGRERQRRGEQERAHEPRGDE